MLPQDLHTAILSASPSTAALIRGGSAAEMCWTAGKADKLKFLKQDGLWYLEESCALKNLDADDAASVRRCGLGPATCAFVGGN